MKMYMHSDTDLIQEEIPSNIISPHNFFQAHPQPRVLRRRWYILLLFSVLAFGQGIIGGTWRYLIKSQAIAKELTPSNVALLDKWPSIMLMVFFLPMTKLVMRYGLRCAALNCALLMAIATGSRCIPFPKPWSFVALHFCAIINGYGGSLTLAGSTTLSNVWFPATERIMATGIILSAGINLAEGSNFLISEFLIPQVNFTSPMIIATTNQSLSTSYFSQGDSDETDNVTSLLTDSLLQSLRTTEYVWRNIFGTEFLICILTFVALVIYFPKCPPFPANVSSTIQRPRFYEQLKMLVRHRSFWPVLLGWALPFGVLTFLLNHLPLMISHHGYRAAMTRWLVFYARIAGAIGCVGVGFLTDRSARFLKPVLMVCMALSSAFFLWFALNCAKVVPDHDVCMYVALLLGVFALNGALPPALELFCETTSPVSEFLSAGLALAVSSLAALVCACLTLIRPLGMDWVMFLLPVLCALSLPLLYLIAPYYRRLQIDLPPLDAASFSSDEEANVSPRDLDAMS